MFYNNKCSLIFFLYIYFCDCSLIRLFFIILKHFIICIVHVQMEDELLALGERWAHICKWAEEYGVKLQTLLMKCSRITEQLSWLQSWFDSKEINLKHMESKNVTEVAEILERIKQLQVITFFKLRLNKLK